MKRFLGLAVVLSLLAFALGSCGPKDSWSKSEPRSAGASQWTLRTPEGQEATIAQVGSGPEREADCMNQLATFAAINNELIQQGQSITFVNHKTRNEDLMVAIVKSGGMIFWVTARSSGTQTLSLGSFQSLLDHEHLSAKISPATTVAETPVKKSKIRLGNQIIHLPFGWVAQNVVYGGPPDEDTKIIVPVNMMGSVTVDFNPKSHLAKETQSIHQSLLNVRVPTKAGEMDFSVTKSGMSGPFRGQVEKLIEDLTQVKVNLAVN